MKALILAGGFGKRLKPLTDQTPKPLLEVAGKPIIVHQIDWLKQYEVKEIILTIGYMKEKFIEFLGSGRRYNVNICYVVEDEPLGTAGAVKNAESLLKNEPYFYVVNGDVLTSLDPSKLLKALDQTTIGAIATVPLPSPYGIIYSDPQDRITGFKEKPSLREYWINAGVYAFKPEILNRLPEKGSIEEAFEKIAPEGKLKTVKYPDIFWKSIDTFKDIEEAEKTLAQKRILSTIYEPNRFQT